MSTKGKFIKRIYKRMAEIRGNKLYVVEFKFGKWIRSFAAGAPTPDKIIAQMTASGLAQKSAQRDIKLPYRVAVYERTGVVKGSKRGGSNG